LTVVEEKIALKDIELLKKEQKEVYGQLILNGFIKI
jgi:hypothetical protein